MPLVEQTDLDRVVKAVSAELADGWVLAGSGGLEVIRARSSSHSSTPYSRFRRSMGRQPARTTRPQVCRPSSRGGAATEVNRLTISR